MNGKVLAWIGIILIIFSCNNKSDYRDLVIQFDNLIYEDPDKAIVKIDSLYDVVVNTDDETTIDLLRLKGTCLWMQNKLDSAKVYLQNSSELASSLNIKDKYIKAEINYALVDATQKNYNTAKAKLESLIYHSMELKDTIGLSKLYINIGEVSRRQGDYIGALENNLKALELNTLLRDEENSAYLYNNISICQKQLFQFEKAIVNQKKALALHSLTNNNYGLASVNNNLGLNLMELDSIPEAIECFKSSVAARKTLGNDLKTATAKLNLALAYFEVDSIDLSNRYLDTIAPIIINEGNNLNKFNLFLAKSKMQLLQRRHKEFKNSMNKATQYFENVDFSRQFDLRKLQFEETLMRGDVKSIKKTYSTLDKYYDKNLKEHFKGILNIENYINNFSNKERELNLKIENEKLTNRIYLGLLIGLCSLLLLFGVISIFLNKRKKQMDKLRLERDLFEKNLSQLSEINEQRKFQDSMILLDDKEGYKIKLSEIAYIKASQGTVEFYDVENQLIIRIHKTLSRFLGEINMDKVFIRISKFHALNKNHISGVSKSSVRVGSKVDLAWSAKYLSSSDLEF